MGNLLVATSLRADRSSLAARQASAVEVGQRGFRSAGKQLDSGPRTTMEGAFGADFSRVRVHSDGVAADIAPALGSHAFTFGEDIAFGPGRYAPHTGTGATLLAHELAHVVQQRRGGGLNAGDCATELDADRAAFVAVRGGPARVSVGSRVGTARQAADADKSTGTATPLYEFVDETGQKKQVTADELAALRKQAETRLRAKLSSVKGYGEVHRDTHESFMKDIHGEAESFSDLVSNPKALIGIAVDMRSGVVPPPISMWGAAIHAAEDGDKALAAGDLREAARMLRLADSHLHDATAEWNKYMDAIQEGGQKLVGELEVVRDVSFAIAITAAVIVAAPVVAGGVAATGATGALATGLTGLGTAAVGAGAGGALRGGADVAAQKVAYGKVDTKKAWAETKRGLKEGGVAGLTAGLAPGLGQAAGVGAEGSTFFQQVGRRVITEGTTNAIGQATDAALQGKSAGQVLRSGATGFATGALTAPLGAAGAKLAASGRPLLSKAVDVAGSGAVAAGVTLATGGSREEAGKQAMIAMASAGALAGARHRPAGEPSRNTPPPAAQPEEAAPSAGAASAVSTSGSPAPPESAFPATPSAGNLPPPAASVPAEPAASVTPAGPVPSAVPAGPAPVQSAATPAAPDVMAPEATPPAVKPEAAQPEWLEPTKLPPAGDVKVRKVRGLQSSGKQSEFSRPRQRDVTREEQLYGIPSKEDWQRTRGGTPTTKLRSRVQEALPIGSVDPAFPSLTVTGTAQADHIVAVDKIRRMPGFAMLNDAAQRDVLNLEDNFMALSPAANASKGGKSIEEWTHSEKVGLPVDPTFRAQLLTREAQLIPVIQERINEHIRTGLVTRNE